MESPVVPFTRNRVVRDYIIIDEESPDSTQNHVASPPIASHDGFQAMDDSLHHDRTMSIKTAVESIATQTRDGANGNTQPLPEDDVHDDFNKPRANSRGHAYRTSLVRTESQRNELRNLDFNAETTTIPSSYAESIASASTSQAPSQITGITSATGGRLPDFFSNEVFRTVLHNPTTAHQLLIFSKSRLCGENMEYLEKVHRYHGLLEQVTRTMIEIHKDFLSPEGSNQINISEAQLLQIRKDMKRTLTLMLPKLETIFDDCSSEIERLVATDIYPRFVRHQMVLSASKALATDRSRYGGLGDCFVLTNPAKADNPIVYASDGFVKVTGYSRNDIIPRNCRFLQGRYSDQTSVKRLRLSIDNRQESVELLLNYKKNGEPFWNLLYVTPLYDYEGRLAFFLGGQINCSTTIHNASDILRILAYSEDVDEESSNTEKGSSSPSVPTKYESNSFFKRFRPQKAVVPPRAPGMEGSLLTRIEKLNLGSQMSEFYTAYSKFIVVNTATSYISFHSYGIITLLYPVKPPKVTTTPGYIPTNINVVQPPAVIAPSSPIPAAQQPAPGPYNANTQSVVGHDIFKFLTQHTMNNLPREYKSTVKNAMRMGQAVSLDLTLCTRRRMGFERFVTHWTPLKDESGKSEFVVLTLGNLE